MHEGLRWFDIKRYGIPVEHELENGSEILYSKPMTNVKFYNYLNLHWK